MATAHRNGLWVVTKGERQHENWRNWLKTHMRYSFFPDRMTVIGEWPPETPDGSRLIQNRLNTIMDQSRDKAAA